INTARTDSFTGTIPPGGSTRWGWGKVNAYAAVQSVFLVSVEEQSTHSVWKIFPNPATDYLLIEGQLQGDEEIKIYSSEGKLLKREKIVQPQIHLAGLANGMYIIEITGKTSSEKFRIVIAG
ncbi:MAG: T9SS type A sorting domain-containing protein, partial [Bacteroidota bacterium]